MYEILQIYSIGLILGLYEIFGLSNFARATPRLIMQLHHKPAV